MSPELVRCLTRSSSTRLENSIHHNDDQDTFKVVEIRVDNATGIVSAQEHNDINISGLAGMMAKSQISDQDEFVLRMVCISVCSDIGQWTLDLKQAHYDKILNMFGLQDLHHLAHTSRMTFDVLPPVTVDNVTEICYSYHISSLAGLYFRHVHAKAGYGVCWGHSSCASDSHRQPNLMSMKTAMLSFARLAPNPFYMMFVLLISIMVGSDRTHCRVGQRAAEIEAHTGYQDWGDPRMTYCLPDTSIERYLDAYIAQLTGMASILASQRRHMLLGQEIINTISTQNYDLSSTLLNTEPVIPRDELVFLERRVRVGQQQIDVLEGRVRNQILAVQNLKARHEMRLSITIANDSKVLAMAMKVLAVLTVVFLPATFVASLFSTTMFNWHLSDEDFVSKRFWIYWAIAIPLTAATVLSYLWVMRRRQQTVASRQDLDDGEELAALSHATSYV